MTGIQSSVGLISGIDYTSIVDQLIQLDSIPKKNLEYRTELLAAEESALANLMTLFLTSSYMIRNLNSIAAFQRCDVTSSNSALLIASKNGTPVEGTHTFTPLQLAAAQQTMAKGVVSDTDALGKTGTITVGKGWTLDNSVELQNLNGGSGVTKGSIRITDGSGTRATIDLRKAITIQDVVDAINDNDTIDVRAELVEDRLVLTDFSGGDLSKFLVQEVSGGTTAASLGIANLRADSDGIAVGASIYRLGEDMALSYLNDGNGVVFDDIWADIVVKCRDGSTVNIDFFYRATTAEIAAGAPEIHKETTVGDLIETINNSKDVSGAGGKVHARISDDGKSLVIEDTTQGANFTTLTQVSTNPVFKTLGLSNGDYSSGTVAPYMDGAKGGKILVKDKAGYEAAIEFTDAEIKNFKSFTEVAAAFTAKLHAANVSFDVTVNDTFNGLKLTETSGGPGSVTFTDDPSGSGNLAAFFGFNLVNDAAPAVPGVNAVSADDGTGGTAALTFADSSQMNGKTFAFTTDENLAGYDPATETLTVYLPPEIVDETDPDTQDALVEAAINAAIGADWAAMRPVGSTASASVVQPAGGLGAQAVADAVSGGQTAIKAEYGGVLGNEPVASIVTPAVPGINAVSADDGTGGTALLTFADTGKMNGKTFAFTTDENLAGYNSATETLMVYIPPEARAITPAVPGVNAVSANNGTGGTALLTFADSSQMNGKTFAFTTDENLAGYDDTTETLTIYLPPETLAEADPNTQDSLVEAAINAAVNANWTDMRPAGSTASAPVVQAASGLGAQAAADAASGGQTAIKAECGGVLGNEPVAEVDAAAQDALVAAAINAAISANWAAMRPAGSTASAPVVQTTSGLGAQAVYDAEYFGQTAIKAEYGGVLGQDAVAAIVSPTEITGKAFAPVNITTRHLIGDLDSVLMSTLNGGSGLSKALAGAIEVQDRAGNTALLDFTQKELDSIQTLNDAVRMLNAKLGTAGIGIAVKINDAKTGLKVEDTTGSTTNALIFRDKTSKEITTPAVSGANAVSADDNTGGTAVLTFANSSQMNGKTFAFTTDESSAGYDSATGILTVYVPPEAVSAVSTPAVSGVNAVSADNGTGGTAALTFADSSQMNGKTFAFTTDESSAGYDSATGILTVYLSPETLAETDPDTQDSLVEAAINAAVNANWTDMRPDGSTASVPVVQTTSGLGAQAVADAASGGQTAIKADAAGAVLGQEPVAAVDAGPVQDSLVVAAINAAISANWTAMRPAGSTASAPVVRSTSGLGAQAVADAANGGRTAIKDGLTGAALGREPVEEVSITHDSDIATQLGLEVNVSASSAGGASLNRQIISYDTKLADLNNGKGVTLTGGKIQITDSAGHTATLAIDAAKHKTVGDIINAINSLSTDLKVIAKINDTGDGIVLEEFAGGTGNFSVIDADSSSKFASELRIAGTVAQSDKDEDGRMRLNGRQSYTVEVEATDSLTSIRDKLNALNAGFSATIIQDGSNAPYRLAITGKTTGAAGAFNIDLSALGLTTENMTEAKDALLVYGDVSTGLVLHSSSNSFKGIVGGIDLTIAGTSTSPITITSADSNVDVKASLSAFVENYNKFRNELNTQMYYSVAENAGNVLYNSSEARALDRDLTNLLQKRVYGIPGITSLADIGITLRSNASDDGVNQSTNTLVFDEAKFEALWESNKEGLQAFFFQERTTLDADGKETTIKTGWAQSFVTVSDSLTDVSYGKISSRLAVIDTLITNNTERAEFMQSRLDTKRARMLAKFYAMEQALAAMSDDMNTISSLASSWSSLQSSTS